MCSFSLMGARDGREYLDMSVIEVGGAVRTSDGEREGDRALLYIVSLSTAMDLSPHRSLSEYATEMFDAPDATMEEGVFLSLVTDGNLSSPLIPDLDPESESESSSSASRG